MTQRAPFAPGVFVEREAVTEQELVAAGVDLERDFPGGTHGDFRRYPVLSEGGWFMVIKHQPTLRSVSRAPWHLFGPVPPLSAGLTDVIAPGARATSEAEDETWA
jgi:hypothetical protein